MLNKICYFQLPMNDFSEGGLQPHADRQVIGLFVADHVNAMLAYWDKDLVCRFANSAYKEWFGRGREDMVDKITIAELLGPELYKKNEPYIKAVLTGTAQHFERDIPIPSGEIRQTTASYYPHISKGEVKGWPENTASCKRGMKSWNNLCTWHRMICRNR